MKISSLSLILLLFISCGKKSEESTSAFTGEPERAVKIPNGTYRSANLSNGGLKYTIVIEVNEDVLRERYTLHSSAAYTTPYWYYDTYYKIHKSVYDGNSNVDVLIDLSVTSIKYRWNHPWYPTQHYCGITDWDATSEREVVGIACPDHEKLPTCTNHAGTVVSLNERSDKKFRSIGHKVFVRAKYTEGSNIIDFPANDDSKGDSPSQRFGGAGDEASIYELTKIPEI